MHPENAREVDVAASFALNRHVLDTAHGFTISTLNCELTITADEARQHPEMQRVVESIMQLRLYTVERAQCPRKVDSRAASHQRANTIPRNPNADGSSDHSIELARSLGAEYDENPELVASIAAMLDAGIPEDIVRGMVEASSRLLIELTTGAA